MVNVGIVVTVQGSYLHVHVQQTDVYICTCGLKTTQTFTMHMYKLLQGKENAGQV